VLLVDDDQPDVGQGRDDREPRADDDVDVTSADPAPFIRPLSFGEPRVEECDTSIEVRSKPIDQWEGERDLRDQDQRRPAMFQGRCDRLDVDRGLAATGHAIEQDRPRVALEDGLRHLRYRLGLGGRQVGRRRPTASQPGWARCQRTTRPLPRLGLDEAALDERRDGRRPVPCRQVRACHPVGSGGKVGEDGPLSGAERSAGRRGACAQLGCHRRARRG
jgi:hypothetical protein